MSVCQKGYNRKGLLPENGEKKESMANYVQVLQAKMNLCGRDNACVVCTMYNKKNCLFNF